jgi:predicted nucleic acid-binding protein
MKSVVVDASVVTAWVLDEGSDYADAVVAALRQVRGAAPPIWSAEQVNALLMAERRGRVTQAEAALLLDLVDSLPIAVVPESDASLPASALALAREHRLSVYDACYLDLAMRLGLALATLDGPLRDAARATGVEIYAPGAGGN